MRAFKLIGFAHDDGTLETPVEHPEKEVHTHMSITAEAPVEQAATEAPAPVTEKIPFDFSVLDTLEPSRLKGGQGRPPAYTLAEVEKFYQARSRGITWTQINGVLPSPFARPGTLAQSVHAAAERHGLVAQRSKRAARKTKEKAAE
jgi:hypothetical protein